MTIYKMVDGVVMPLTPEEIQEIERLANNPPPPLIPPGPGPVVELPVIPGLD
jgi:hypothetical protein